MSALLSEPQNYQKKRNSRHGQMVATSPKNAIVRGRDTKVVGVNKCYSTLEHPYHKKTELWWDTR